MTVGVVEIDTMRVAWAAVGCDAGVFQGLFDTLVVA